MKVTLFNDMPDEGFLSMDRYAQSLGRALREGNFPDLEVADFTTTGYGRLPGGLGRFVGRYVKYPWKMQLFRAPLNHVTDHSYGFLTYFLPRRRTVVTCHDLAPLLAETPTLKSRLKQQLWKVALRGTLRASVLITGSENNRRDILKYTTYPAENLHVIHYGLDERFRPWRDTPEYTEWAKTFRQQYGLTEDLLVLHVGRYSPRKNFEGLIQAFARLHTSLNNREGGQRVRLLQVGGVFSPEHRTLLNELGLQEAVTQIPFVTEAELPFVYNLASALLFPSHYEGFGWPPLEAMACGTPTVTSNTSSLPEVVGDAALTAAPDDYAGLAAALEQALTDPVRRADLIKRGLERAGQFGWHNCAEQTLAVYRALLTSQKDRPARPSRVRAVPIAQEQAKTAPKILFVSATTIIGGAEVYLTTLAGQLQADGCYRPVVVCPAEGDFPDRLRRRDIPVVIQPLAAQIVGAARASFKLNAFSLAKIGLDYARAVAGIYRVARRERAAVVQINSMKAGLYAAPAGWLAGKPVVWDYKDLLEGSFSGPRLRRIILLWIRLFVRQVVTASRVIRDEFVAAGVPASKVEAIYNGLDLDRFNAKLKGEQHSLIERLDLPRDAELVTIIGRLAPWKGHNVFLKAAARIKQARPKAQFLIVGDLGFDPPSYRDSLVEMAAELGLSDCTHWLGFRSDQAELIAASDVLVHSSILPEPLGLTPIEAQALSTPVVAAAAGGCLETVEDGVTGLLYPMGDPEALAQAVIRLLADPDLRTSMGRAGRERVERMFDVRDNAHKMEAVYRRLLDRK